MNEEHDGTDQGNPSEEEYREFRRMMDSAWAAMAFAGWSSA